MPEGTLLAFMDHGRVGPSPHKGFDWVCAEAAAEGIELDRITADLERDGVEAFAASYERAVAHRVEPAGRPRNAAIRETEPSMAIVSRGFRGRRRREQAEGLPPGQYVTDDFPVFSAGPTPHTPTERWTFAVVARDGRTREWTWDEFQALPADDQH